MGEHAVAAVAHCLVARLAASEAPGPPVATWRIAENRFFALRDGVEGTLADLETGRRRPTRERLHALLEPVAERLRCAAELAAPAGSSRSTAPCARDGLAAAGRSVARRRVRPVAAALANGAALDPEIADDRPRADRKGSFTAL